MTVASADGCWHKVLCCSALMCRQGQHIPVQWHWHIVLVKDASYHGRGPFVVTCSCFCVHCAHSLIHSFITHSSLIHLLIYSQADLFTHSSLIHSLTHFSFTYSFTDLFIHLLTHSFIYLPIHSFTHSSLIHLCAPSTCLPNSSLRSVSCDFSWM